MKKVVLNDTLKAPQRTEDEKRLALNAITAEYLEHKSFKRIFSKYRVGIYSTIVVNLLVLIFLLAYQIGTMREAEGDFILLNEYFDQLPEVQKPTEEQEKKDISAQVDEMIRNARSGTSARNVAVNTEDANRTSVLKDAKGINSSVYEEARQLQEKMDATRRMMQEQQSNDHTVATSSTAQPAQTQTYEGPTVLTWTLEGRKAMSLPVPAYKCKNGGDVTVRIVVNQQGYVTAATVDVQRSASDPALHQEARNTALRSRFAASAPAPAKQEGVIVYRFIAQ